jgi:hypothetical protein
MMLILLVHNKPLEYISYSQFLSIDWLSKTFVELVVFLFRIPVLMMFLITQSCLNFMLDNLDLTGR